MITQCIYFCKNTHRVYTLQEAWHLTWGTMGLVSQDALHFQKGDDEKGNSTGLEHSRVTRHLTQTVVLQKTLQLFLPGFIHYCKAETHNHSYLFPDNKYTNSKNKNLVILFPIVLEVMRGYNKMPYPTQLNKVVITIESYYFPFVRAEYYSWQGILTIRSSYRILHLIISL